MGEYESPANAPAEAPTAWLGRVVAERYRIVDLLGEGGMGTVYVAEHLGLQKQVAFKVILPSFMGNSEVSARFSREAMTTAQLEHAHIVSALDYGTLSDGSAYLVMPLVRGPSLRAVIDDLGPRPWPWVRTVAIQIAEALTVAHAAGVVHRDLKPDNVLLEIREGGEPFARITDFGIARIMEDAALTSHQSMAEVPTLTRVGVVIGTPGYMPPEQAMGQPVDARADLYAFGVVLWELLSGTPPFPGETLAQVITQQLTASLPELPATVPDEARALLHLLLSPDPDNRPPDAAAVSQALHRTSATLCTPPNSSAVFLRQASHAVVTASRITATTAGRLGRWSWPRLQSGSRTAIAKFRAAPPRTRIAITAAAALALCALVALGFRADAPAEDTVPTPGVLHSVRHAVRTVIAKAPPPEVAAHIATLASDDSAAKDRRTSADWLLAHEPRGDVPDYARAMAQLEEANTCKDRSAAIEAIVDADDERAIPALRRLDRRPRRGCGFLGFRDCLTCVRKDLRNALGSLGADVDAPTTKTSR